jgi:hypothetical protein
VALLVHRAEEFIQLLRMYHTLENEMTLLAEEELQRSESSSMNHRPVVQSIPIR